ncbi:hypothetical protein QOZ80_1BG0069960 [Eleusine coracana subsp. coracana]|nr:hypothetical protein QOZ80_1BG0069960 [Eleusine coracana subsp. coracana]
MMIFCVLDLHADDRKGNTSGSIRLRLLHQQHPCSPGGNQQPSLSWHRSRSLERESQLAARLFFRRRHVPPTKISAAVIGNREFYGFVAQVTLGTPPTRQNMLIDTAAAFSWVQCEPCSPTPRTTSTARCFYQDGPRFDPSASSTYRKVSCTSPSCVRVYGDTSAPGICAAQENRCVYEIWYMDGSESSGRIGTDTLTFGDRAIPGFIFGCSQEYQGVFGRYSGTLGFATGKTSFFSQALQTTGQYRAFSYYLPSPTSVGYIQVDAYEEGGLDFTPMFMRGTDHYIALTAMASSSDPVMRSIGDACRRARQAFSFSSFVCREQTGTHLLRIQGYSGIEKKFDHSTRIKSPSFRAGGHTWTVEYYPNGFTNNGHVTVALTHWGVSYIGSLGNLFLGTSATAACNVSILDRQGNLLCSKSGIPVHYNLPGIHWHDIMTAKEAADFREEAADFREMLRVKKEDSLYVKCEVTVQKMEKESWIKLFLRGLLD